MLKVGLDISALDPNFKAHFGRGIGRYVKELASFFRSNPGLHNLVVDFFDHKSLVDYKWLDGVGRALPLGRQTFQQQILHPFKLNSGPLKSLDFLHFPAHMDVPAWCPKPYVLTVLDLIPLVCEDLYRKGKVDFRFKFARWLEIEAIKNAKRIIAISQQTADDLNSVLRIPYEKIDVVPLGVDDKFFKEVDEDVLQLVASKFQFKKGQKLLLYVGGIDQRKNISGFLEVLAELKNLSREKDEVSPVLLLAGRIEEDKNYPSLKRDIESLDLKDSVRILGYVPDEELLALYKLASVFVFPSLYEGFGLPPLEAMAAGLPVVSSNRSCMPDILGNAAVLLDPDDIQNFAVQINNVISSPKVNASLREAGLERAKSYTWQKTGELTLRSYETLGAMKSAAA